MVLRAHEIMTRRVVSVSPETPFDRARWLVTANRFDALPVVDPGHHVVGLLTTYDLLRVAMLPAASRPVEVGEAMTGSPLTMSVDTDVAVLAHRLRHYGELRAMPLVGHGILAGIVTRGDLLRRPPHGGALGRFVYRRRHRRRVSDTEFDADPPIDVPAWGEVDPATPTGEVMTPEDRVVSTTESASVDTAAHLLRTNRFSALPVEAEAGELVGIMSEADLIPDRLSGRRTSAPRRVGQAMTRDVITVTPTTPLGDTARRMIDGRLRLVPVVAADGRLAGVVSRSDLLTSS